MKNSVIGLYIEPLAKLPTEKCYKLISAPEKTFFKPGKARNAIFDSLPRLFLHFYQNQGIVALLVP